MEYNLKVDFENELILPRGTINLVQNDYNSTTINFAFDEKYANYTKVFEMKYPNGQKYVTELKNDKVILGLINVDGTDYPMLQQEGTYRYEILCINANSKITNYAIGEFEVRQELVSIDDEEIELTNQYPILDQLIDETNTALEQANNLDIDATKEENKTTITITKKDGTQENVEILDGEKGDSYDITSEDYQTIAEDVLKTEQIQQVITNTNDAVNTSETALLIAKQSNFAKGYNDYQSLINELNIQSSDKYNVGQSFLIVTLNVPDLWVSSIEETIVPYEYIDDTTIIASLQSLGYIQIGYYKLSMLETLKQDLTNYVKNTDYSKPGDDVGGVIRTSRFYGITCASNGLATTVRATNNEIDARESEYKVLTPKSVPYVVKSGITNNTYELTNEEKTSAKSWLGINDIKIIEPDEEGNYNCHIADMENGLYVLPQGTRVQYHPNGTTTNFGTEVLLYVTTRVSDNVKVFEVHGKEYGHYCYGYEGAVYGTIATKLMNYIPQTQQVNTFTQQQKITAVQENYTEDSTNIPTMAWVKRATPLTSATLPNPIAPQTEYYLGEQTSVNIQVPTTTPTLGSYSLICFTAGEGINVTVGNYIVGDIDYEFVAGNTYEILLTYNGTNVVMNVLEY